MAGWDFGITSGELCNAAFFTSTWEFTRVGQNLLLLLFRMRVFLRHVLTGYFYIGGRFLPRWPYANDRVAFFEGLAMSIYSTCLLNKTSEQYEDALPLAGRGVLTAAWFAPLAESLARIPCPGRLRRPLSAGTPPWFMKTSSF
jgi:hypothetical protein